MRNYELATFNLATFKHYAVKRAENIYKIIFMKEKPYKFNKIFAKFEIFYIITL